MLKLGENIFLFTPSNIDITKLNEKVEEKQEKSNIESSQGYLNMNQQTPLKKRA